MKHMVALTALFALLSTPVMAQAQAPAAGAAEAEEPVDVNAAIKTISELTGDATKVAGYCAISKEMDGIAETDTAKMEEVSTKMETYLTGLGEQYAEAFEAAESVAPESEDGKKLDTTLGALEDKCGGE